MSTSSEKKAATDEPLVDYRVYVANDHQKMVPLSGLLVDDPSLESAQMTVQEWDSRLRKFLTSEPR